MAQTQIRAGTREWTALAVLVLPCLVVSMGSNVLHLALPAISEQLRPTNAQLLWIVDGYVFLLAGSLMTMGALADRVGRRRLLLLGGGAYGVLSLLAALSTTPQMLVAARMLLGVAGATLMPSTLSLIRSMFADARQRSTALGVWTASFALGGVIGPVVGGLLLGAFWWGSVFVVAVPVMLLLVVLGPRLLPEFRDEDAAPVDLRSAGLSVVAVLLVVYGVTRLAESGAGAEPLVALVVGSAAGVGFLTRQRRHPTFGLELFRRRTFALPVATNAIAFFVLYGMQFLLAQYLQLVLGLSPLEAGLWTIPSALGYLAGSVAAPRVAHRLRPGAALARLPRGVRPRVRPACACPERRRSAALRGGVGDPVVRPRPRVCRRHRACRVRRAGAPGREGVRPAGDVHQPGGSPGDRGARERRRRGVP